MKILIIAILLAFASLSSLAQSADEKVGEMMNSGQWFELRDFISIDSGSVTPFLNDFAEAMLAHFFNKP